MVWKLAGRFVLMSVAFVIASVGPAVGCDTGTDTDAEALIGSLTRETIESIGVEWVWAQVRTEIDSDAAQGLALVDPGASVTVYLGTWCSDSRRELGRFWRALDEVMGMAAFEIEYIGVDREKREPAELIGEVGLERVPTFIVTRDGTEVGRVVEQSPHGIERDLVALLTGQVEGPIGIESTVSQ